MKRSLSIKPVQILLLLAVANTAAICTPPEAPETAALKRATEIVEIADWLRAMAEPFAPTQARLPFMQPYAVPLTDTKKEDTPLPGVERFFDIDCDLDFCSGSMTVRGRHPDGIEQFAAQGTWTAYGTWLTGAGRLRYERGFSLAWQVADAQLMVELESEYAPIATAMTAYGPLAVTTGQATIQISACRWRNQQQSDIARCLGSGAVSVAQPKTHSDVPWQVSLYDQLLPNGWSASEYPDGTTAWSKPVRPGVPVAAGENWFGIQTITTTTDSGWQSTANFPEGEVYHSQEDVATPATSGRSLTEDTWYFRRTIQTYNGLTRQMEGDFVPQGNARATLAMNTAMQARNIEGVQQDFDARGTLEYRTLLGGMRTSWQGALQEPNGSIMLIQLTRDFTGQWSLSGHYDYALSPQVPDEEYSIRFRSDGSGEGVAFYFTEEEEEDAERTLDNAFVRGSETSGLRHEVSFSLPQPGARLTPRDTND